MGGWVEVWEWVEVVVALAMIWGGEWGEEGVSVMGVSVVMTADLVEDLWVEGEVLTEVRGVHLEDPWERGGGGFKRCQNMSNLVNHYKNIHTYIFTLAHTCIL